LGAAKRGRSLHENRVPRASKKNRAAQFLLDVCDGKNHNKHQPNLRDLHHNLMAPNPTGIAIGRMPAFASFRGRTVLRTLASKNHQQIIDLV
jgi:hypothetical protein